MVNAAEFWGGSIAGGIVLLAVVYFVALSRARKSEQLIGRAITAMSQARGTAESAPQRALLRAVAETLLAQERAVTRIEGIIRKSARRERDCPEALDLLRELLALQEPQQLITDFLAEHGGGPGSEAFFGSLAAGLVRAATLEVYADEAPADLEELLLIASNGGVADVAVAGAVLGQRPCEHGSPAPRVADLHPDAVGGVVHALDQATRRQLRLATVLHGQAEALLRLRSHQNRRRGGLAGNDGAAGSHGGEHDGQVGERGRGVLDWARPWKRMPWGRPWMMMVPRLPDYAVFRAEELAVLEVALDAVGEAVDSAAEQVANGEPMRAVYLLAGVRVPVPAGLPGRIYQQESLAQVRPLAALGIGHRLAVCRWATSAVQEIARSGAEPLHAGNGAGGDASVRARSGLPGQRG